MSRSADDLRLVPGQGLIARRGHELLFVSDPDATVVGVFVGAPLGTGVEAVVTYVEEHDDVGGDLVLIDWSETLHVAVFGDVEVTSNQRGLVRLRSADEGTLAERRIRTFDAPVCVGVDRDAANPATSLRDGVVPAGGFELELYESASPASATGPAAPRTAPMGSDPADEPAGAPSSASPDRATNRGDDAEITPSATALADAVLDGVGDDRYRVAPDDETIVPDAAMLEVIAEITEPAPAPGDRSVPEISEVPEVPDGPQIPDMLEIPDLPDTPGLPPIPDLPDLPATPGRGGAGQRVLVSWRLEFADGRHEPVDSVLLIGRKPSPPETLGEGSVRLVALDDRQLSRSHLEVRATGDELRLIDLGSRNGSFVVTSGDGQLVRLEPDTPMKVAPGTIVQIGSVRFVVEADEPW